MRTKYLLFLIISLILSTNANLNAKSRKNVKEQNFFNKEDIMQMGVFYYPEQWKRSQWKRDLDNIAKLGFDFTHFAEFSWTFLEPNEGEYDFEWLDHAIDLADKAGLKVVLCTPSLCPPAWMGDKYPEIYLVDAYGRRTQHGIRANASISNKIYQQFVMNITSKLVERYGKDTRISGWQLDNEPLAKPDYSESSRIAFQKWLRNRYKTIEKLNEVWVGEFWSTRYNNFDQVLIPNEVMNDEDKLSPHSILDFRRFTADVTAEFLNNQADIIRKSKIDNQWITTNYTNATKLSDPRRSDRLDFPTFTLYLVSGSNKLGGVNFRTGNPFRLYEACDFFRPIKGVTGIMELQPGQVNWAGINPMLQPGSVYMWIMQAMSGGCSFVCTYRYRSPLHHSEMYHDGIVGTDGVTLSTGGEEFVKAINDLKKLRKLYDKKNKIPKKVVKRKTALLWDHEVMWDLDIQKQTYLWNTWNFRNRYTSVIKSTGAPVDFISERDNFDEYPFVVAPAYQLIDQKLVDKWENYVKNGGNLILTCRTGHKDKNGHFFESKLAKPIWDLIGAEVEFFDMLLPDMSGTIKTGEKEYKWNCWSDILKPQKGTETLAYYNDQFYKGKSAVTYHKYGKGSVTFIGVNSKDGNLERDMVREVYKRANVQIEDYPKGVYVECRNGFYVGVNYSGESHKLDISSDKIILGENPLNTSDVIIWRE